MTGWRIGWGISTPELIKAMTTVQGQITSGASSISQAAALAALEVTSSHIEERCAKFRARRDRLVGGLNEIEGITCSMPDGAFYVFPSCAGLIGGSTVADNKLTDEADFCRHALETQNLVLVPGRAFGMPGHFRISYAYGDEDLIKGLDRVQNASRAVT